ncbi:CinA family protein [Amylibacter sp.]|nr:CinA family protein [Amylibacter sp.]
MSHVKEILKLSQKIGWRISTAESCTGGLISSVLTSIPGSSVFYDRGFITYSNDAKINMLGVSRSSLITFGAVSEQVAIEMADGSIKNSLADLALSVTGIAGPGGSDYKKEGTVCFGLALKDGLSFSKTKFFGAIGRDNVRNEATNYAIKLIFEKLSQNT